MDATSHREYVMKPSERPNILILFPDQARYDTIAAAGYPWMKTPHLDRLVREGCLFTNAYTPCPLCMPARHSAMTGKTPRSHGYFGITDNPIQDPGLPTLPRTLSDHGYATAAVGKMHFHPPRRHHGFEKMVLMEEIPRHRHEDEYAQHLSRCGLGHLQNLHGIRPLLYHEPQIALMPEEHHGANWVGRTAVEWLESVQDQPFFLLCGWINPHPPWNIPPRLRDLYRDAPIPTPIPRSREFPFVESVNPYYGDHDSPQEMRKIREAYLTMVSMVDDNVGRILRHLERTGLLDHTVVIYTSDHGEMLQDKGFYQKSLPYESAVRIPLVIRYPKRFRPGSQDARFADLMDLFPTLLDLAQIDARRQETKEPRQFDGVSLVSEASRQRQYQRFDFHTGRPRWTAVRDQQYKYVYFYNGGTEQFFDLRKDPRELRNLIRTGEAPREDYARLKAKCVELEKRYGPEGYVEGDRMIAFPAEEVRPETNFDASAKYPAWAHRHFQRFAGGSPAVNGDCFARELRSALGVKDVSARLDQLAPGQHWKQAFLEEYRKFSGGNPAKDRWPEA